MDEIYTAFKKSLWIVQCYISKFIWFKSWNVKNQKVSLFHCFCAKNMRRVIQNTWEIHICTFDHLLIKSGRYSSCWNAFLFLIVLRIRIIYYYFPLFIVGHTLHSGWFHYRSKSSFNHCRIHCRTLKCVVLFYFFFA